MPTLSIDPKIPYASKEPWVQSDVVLFLVGYVIHGDDEREDIRE
jgi:hypothetical protein